MESGIKDFWQALKTICFPPACLACGSGLPYYGQELLFCASCLAEVKAIEEPFCSLCGVPFPAAAGGSHLCSTCLNYAWHFNRARALVHFSEPIARAVHALKYSGKTSGLSTFAALKKRFLRPDDIRQPDLIIPVPLHARRLRQRGFNQAQLLAGVFLPGEKARIRTSFLERCKWTEAQTGLSGAARRKNIKGAFMVKEPELVRGKKILLVDDVFTTGATVDECAKVLRRAGALEVQVLTLARACD